jgi:ATP-dependent DNA helicase PIF1
MGQIKVQQVPLVFKKISSIKSNILTAPSVVEIEKTLDKAKHPSINDLIIESTKEPIDKVSQMLNEQFVFLTGSAGSGKTFSINQKNIENPDYIELGATTGIAAINLDTKTINSILKYYNTDSLMDSYIDQKLHWRLREIREEKKVLGIEEVSMMPAKQLDIIFDAINEINEDQNPRKLGLHIIGDLCQLPPVSTKTDKQDIVVKARCWPYFQQNMIKLDKIWRQSNIDFINAINQVRAGNGYEAVRMLKACGVNFIPQLIDKFDGTTLITKNDLVDDYNAKRLAEISQPIITSIPLRRGEQLSEWKNQIPTVMRFKIGAYVMILSNDTPEFTYVNGDTGEIISYDEKKDIFTIKLKRNNKEVQIKRITRANTIKKQPEQRHFSSSFTPYVDTMSKKWVIGDVKYHPLRLAWATTIHKSQGLSLDKVQIDATQQFFGFPGMSYVAISRARTPENLYIVGNEPNLISKIKTNHDVLNYV